LTSILCIYFFFSKKREKGAGRLKKDESLFLPAF